MIDTIYLALAARLKDRLDPKTVDLWNTQPANTQIAAVHLPAIFIDFDRIEWKDNQSGLQEGRAEIRIWVVQNTLAESRYGGHSTDRAMKPLQYLTQVHTALQGFSGDGFGSLTRVATAVDHDHDHLLVHSHTYITQITDTSALDAGYIDQPVDFQVTGEIDGLPPLFDGQ